MEEERASKGVQHRLRESRGLGLALLTFSQGQSSELLTGRVVGIYSLCSAGSTCVFI